MIEPPKIVIVHKTREPQSLADTLAEAVSWIIESCPGKAVQNGPMVPSKNYLAVVFPFDSETPGIQRRLSDSSPGAQIVGCRDSDKYPAGSLSKSEASRLLIQLPMPFLIRRRVESFSAAKAHRRELISARRRADDLQDSFSAFSCTVDSSSNNGDRKLGKILLIDKILCHVQAEGCVLYLFGEGEPTLQRACSTGNIKGIDRFAAHATSSIMEKVPASGPPCLNNIDPCELTVPCGRESAFINSILRYPLVRKLEKIWSNRAGQ